MQGFPGWAPPCTRKSAVIVNIWLAEAGAGQQRERGGILAECPRVPTGCPRGTKDGKSLPIPGGNISRNWNAPAPHLERSGAGQRWKLIIKGKNGIPGELTLSVRSASGPCFIRTAVWTACTKLVPLAPAAPQRLAVSMSVPARQLRGSHRPAPKREVPKAGSHHPRLGGRVPGALRGRRAPSPCDRPVRALGTPHVQGGTNDRAMTHIADSARAAPLGGRRPLGVSGREDIGARTTCVRTADVAAAALAVSPGPSRLSSLILIGLRVSGPQGEFDGGQPDTWVDGPSPSQEGQPFTGVSEEEQVFDSVLGTEGSPRAPTRSLPS